jgi:hypothetical protein
MEIDLEVELEMKMKTDKNEDEKAIDKFGPDKKTENKQDLHQRLRQMQKRNKEPIFELKMNKDFQNLKTSTGKPIKARILTKM